MFSSVWVLVLIIVMVFAEINARGWQPSSRGSLLKTKKSSKSSVIYSSGPIAQNLTTKKHTTILARVKKRLESTTRSLTEQVTKLTPEFTTLNDLRKTSKYTTELAIRRNSGHTITVPSRIPESTPRHIAEFTTLNAITSTHEQTAALKTLPAFIHTPAFTTLNVPTSHGKALARWQVADRGTRIAFSGAPAFTTINIPKHTFRRENKLFVGHTAKQATRAIFSQIPAIKIGQTPEISSDVPRRIPELTTLHSVSLKKTGSITELATRYYTTEPTRPTTILAVRRIPERTQQWKSESANTHILKHSLRSTTIDDHVLTPGFTTTLATNIVTKSALKQAFLSKTSPKSATKTALRLTPEFSTTFEAEISPTPRIKTTIKETPGKRHRFNQTLGLINKLALKPGARNSPELAKTRSKTAIRLTPRVKTRSTIKQTPGITNTHNEIPRSVTTFGLKTKTKPISKKIHHSLVTIAASSRIHRYLRYSTKNILSRRTSKHVFSRKPVLRYRHSHRLTPRTSLRPVHRQTFTFKTKTKSSVSSRFATLPNTTRHTRLAPSSTSILTFGSALGEKIEPSTRYDDTVTETTSKMSSAKTLTKMFEPSQASGSEFNGQFEFSPGSEYTGTIGFTAKSTTTQMQKNIDNQLWVGVWRPWFTQDANPVQDLELGLTENLSTGYHNGMVHDTNTDTKDIDTTQSTIPQILIDEILKLIEELNQNTNTYSNAIDLTTQNITSTGPHENVSQFGSKEEEN